MPADTFVTTVERYNELCAKGVDEDFCKNPRFLYPIDEPPFYASKVGAVLLEVVGGANINTDFQCLDKQGNPIEGLYAVGNHHGRHLRRGLPDQHPRQLPRPRPDAGLSVRPQARRRGVKVEPRLAIAGETM